MRHPSERRRVVTVAVVGVIVGVGLAIALPWQVAVLGGWDVGTLTLLVWVWLSVHALDPVETRALATREDDSRAATRAVILLASVMSLFAVGFALVKAKQSDGGLAVALTVQSIATVVFAWAVVHVAYLLRYAHLYYSNEPGGIDFHDEDPDYGDFAYLAFTIGMTFQVSDTDLQSRQIRRVLLGHAMLSYLFGTVIVALTINVVASIVS